LAGKTLWLLIDEEELRGRGTESVPSTDQYTKDFEK